MSGRKPLEASGPGQQLHPGVARRQRGRVGRHGVLELFPDRRSAGAALHPAQDPIPARLPGLLSIVPTLRPRQLLRLVILRWRPGVHSTRGRWSHPAMVSRYQGFNFMRFLFKKVIIKKGFLKANFKRPILLQNPVNIWRLKTLKQWLSMYLVCAHR